MGIHRLVDALLAPEVFTPAAMWLVADQAAFTLRGLLTGLLLFGISGSIPALTGVVLFRKGLISDLRLTSPRARTHPALFAAMLLAIALNFAVIRIFHLPPRFTAFFVAVLVVVVLAHLTGLRIKVSGHAIAASGFFAVAVTFADAAGWLALPLVVLVAWSRVAGGFHSSTEVLAGALLGGGVPLAVFLLYGML